MSASFDGNDVASAADNAVFDGTFTAFTVEAWFYVTAAPTGWATVTRKDQMFQLGFNESGQPYSALRINSNWDGYSATGVTVPTNQWVHYALQYNSDGVCDLWLDGDRVDTRTRSTAGLSDGSTAALFVGAEDASGTSGFSGLVSDLRISSSARYTTGSTITPPSSPLENDASTIVLYTFADSGNLGDDSGSSGVDLTLGSNPYDPSYDSSEPFAASGLALPIAQYYYGQQ